VVGWRWCQTTVIIFCYHHQGKKLDKKIQSTTTPSSCQFLLFCFIIWSLPRVSTLETRSTNKNKDQNHIIGGEIKVRRTNQADKVGGQTRRTIWPDIPPAGWLFRRLDYYSDRWTIIPPAGWRFHRLLVFRRLDVIFAPADRSDDIQARDNLYHTGFSNISSQA